MKYCNGNPVLPNNGFFLHTIRLIFGIVLIMSMHAVNPPFAPAQDTTDNRLETLSGPYAAALSPPVPGPTQSRQDHLTELTDRRIPPESHIAKPSRQHPDQQLFTSFEIPDHPLIDYYRKKYSHPNRIKWLTRSLERARYYRLTVYEAIKKYDAPPELLFLPVVESAYYPYAVSRSGAVGIWQFMTNSIGPYGITIDSWVDERRDFLKSTEAAVRKLNYNYEKLGDWPLAIAAYNCGLTRMLRIVRETGCNDYWKLIEEDRLPRETAHFIPKFYAILSLLFNKTDSGVPISWEPGVQWERIPLETAVDIRLLAEKSGTPIDIIRRGNSELNYFITPPVSSGYSLKIPAEYSDVIRETLSNRGNSLIRFHLYSIRSGDTLSELADHYGVSVPLILRYNPEIHPLKLRIGSRIIIPYFKEIDPFRGNKTAAATNTASFSETYIVKQGDSLWSIAARYDTTPELLAEANALPLHAYIQIGQELKVPQKNLSPIKNESQRNIKNAKNYR